MQAHHHVRAAGYCPPSGEHHAGFQRGRPGPRREFRQPAGSRLFPAGNGSKNMNSRYAAHRQAEAMQLRALEQGRPD